MLGVSPVGELGVAGLVIGGPAPLHEKQQRLIEAALRTAEKHGLALGGTAALIACGFPGFDARKIDLVTPRDQVRDARDVKKELRRVG